MTLAAIIFITILLSAGPSFAAPAFDAEVHSECANCTTVPSFNITVAGSNIVVVVDIHMQTAPLPPVSSVTVGGVSGTLVVAQTQTDATDIRSEQWIVKLANSTGVKAIAVVLSGQVNQANVIARSYNGVDQTTPTGTGVANFAASNPATVDITSAAGELVIDSVYVKEASSNEVVGAGQTQRYLFTDGQSFANGGSDEAGAATVTMSWTTSGAQYWIILASSLKPVAATTLWNSVGTLGSKNSETANQASLVLNPTAQLDTDNTGACLIAVDNNQTTDGDEAAVSSVTDSGSNTWIKAREFTNGQGTAQTGATVSLWYTKVTGNVAASSGNITANFSNSTSRDAAAISCWEFSNTISGYTISVAGGSDLANDAADPGAITLGSLASVEYLWLHGLAGEGTNSDAYTWDADYTQFTADGTCCLGNALPTYFNSGTFTASATAITPPFPASTAANDIAILVVTSEAETISLATANGFVAIPGSPQGAGTAATNPGISVAVFWKRLVGGDSAPVTNDSGNHQAGQIHVFRGVKTTGNPWDVTAAGNDGGSNDTTAVIPGATTTVTNNLVVLIQGSSFNGTSTAECGAATNADLANITERTDNTNTIQLGSGHCLITGEKATAGAYTDTTLTMANTTFKGAFSLALPGVGAAASNMHVRGGYRVFIGTTDTVDVTSTTADRDYAQILTALLATAPTAGACSSTLTLLGIGTC